MGQATDPTAVVSDEAALSAGTVNAVKATNRGSLRVAQSEPARAAGCRSRFVFSPGVVANASAPVADMPTTAAAMALWNGEPTESLFIETVSAHAASGILGLGGALLVGLSSVAQAAAVANGTGVVGPSRLGGGTKTSLAKFGAAVTLTGAATWFPVATGKMIAESNIGFALIADLGGLIEVPPGFCLGVTVLAPTGTTAKFSFSVSWRQYENRAYA